jgi:coproporphyrinogen III oxidase
MGGMLLEYNIHSNTLAFSGIFRNTYSKTLPRALPYSMEHVFHKIRDSGGNQYSLEYGGVLEKAGIQRNSVYGGIGPGYHII